MPYPFGEKLARKEARKARRAVKVAEMAALDAVVPGNRAKSLQDAPGRTIPAPMRQSSKKRIGGLKRRKPVPARKRAFLDLKAACRDHVFARNKALNAGMCEIAMACGGAESANTWYHAFPQKGGNGLKYDPRSHFASCSRCNMGEYGARYRGDKTYENRHKHLLGERLHGELAALHGRRPISAPEARAMALEIRRKTLNREWS